MKEQRFKRVIENMEKHNIDQMIITAPSSVFYLTGKWIEPGERMFALYVNSNGDSKLFVNELFPIEEDLGVELKIYNDSQDPIAILCEAVVDNKTLGIDKEWPSRFLISLMNKKSGLKFIDSSFIVDEVRMIKDAEEIQLMREASSINDKAVGELIKLVSTEYSEKKLCKILSDIYEKHGGEGYSFHPLVAFGGNAAEPHHDSDNTMVKSGDSVILDIGCKYKHYSSDMTRTVFFKEPSEESKKIYNIVKEANLRGIEAVKPGVKLGDIDKAAREVIEKEGYGKYFTHRTGHCIGIDVHEFPYVGAGNDIVAQEGMIFSVEPGIYMPGQCGVRIEDLVVVTKDGCENLNSYTKDLIIL